MVDNTFSFNNDVTIKVYTHDNVPTTRYADLIKHLKDEKPVLVLMVSLLHTKRTTQAGTRQTRSTPWSRLPMSPSLNRTESISSVVLRRMTQG